MRQPSHRTRALLLLFSTGLIPAACRDLGPSDPEGPGTISVRLDSPNGAEGSAVFEVAGGTGLGVVTSDGGEVFYSHNYGTMTSKVVVVMDDPGQIEFKISTADAGVVPAVSVIQVAGPDDELRASLGGYDVRVIQVQDGGGS